MSYVEVKAALRWPIVAAANRVSDSVGIGREGHEWDIHLTTTTQYKSSIRSAKNMSQARRDYLLQVSQPKHFWRCILRNDGLDLMEVCFDGTLPSKVQPGLLGQLLPAAFRQRLRSILSREAHGEGVAYLRRMLMHEYKVTSRAEADRLQGRHASDSVRR